MDSDTHRAGGQYVPPFFLKGRKKKARKEHSHAGLIPARWPCTIDGVTTLRDVAMHPRKRARRILDCMIVEWNNVWSFFFLSFFFFPQQRRGVISLASRQVSRYFNPFIGDRSLNWGERKLNRLFLFFLLLLFLSFQISIVSWTSWKIW